MEREQMSSGVAGYSQRDDLDYYKCISVAALEAGERSQLLNGSHEMGGKREFQASSECLVASVINLIKIFFDYSFCNERANKGMHSTFKGFRSARRALVPFQVDI